LLIVNSFSQSGWQIIPSGTTANLKSIHYISPYDLYFCGDVLMNWKSTDNGQTWTSNIFPSSVTLNDIFVIDQNTAVTVGNGGTIRRTTDAGSSWTTINSGITDDLLSISFVDSFGICVGISQTILYSSNGGASWNIAQSGFFGGGFYGASMLTPQIGFVAGQNSIFQPLLGRTTDSGVNWDFTSFYLNNNEGSATGVDFTDMNTGYVSASVWDGRGAIAKTTDHGNNWSTTFFINPLWGIDFPVSGASLIGYAVGESGTILKTSDAGLSWQPQQSGTVESLNNVFFLDTDMGFAVGSNGIILKTIDGGVPVELTSFSATVNKNDVMLNWVTATELNNRGFEIEKLYNNRWVVIGFVEGNGTTTEPRSYSFTDKNLERGIYKYRLKQTDFDGTFDYSDIAEAEVMSPGKFMLSQNYPNPFNPVTKIKYSISSVAASLMKPVQLKIFDVLGNEIATLVNEESTAGGAGEYEVEFDASLLPSGVYFYRLRAGFFVETKKMILLR
jgi:photosystem II stability/assembly factor-like uncharacterized protein